MRVFVLLITVFGLFLTSCTSQRAVNNYYLQNAVDTSGKFPVSVPKLVIQKGDLLSIRVYSTAIGINPQADAPYNLSDGGSTGAGFLVDGKGNIEYPQLGVLHVEGLTREELAELIKNKLQGQLNNPSVIVRFLNYRITILGEVGSPNTFTIPVENITILEALGMAGDVTEFGRRDRIRVIREVDGQTEIGVINLTSDSMFVSPYYRLQQNDVVLVEPTQLRSKQQDQQIIVQQIGIATSILTAIALILNLIR